MQNAHLSKQPSVYIISIQQIYCYCNPEETLGPFRSRISYIQFKKYYNCLTQPNKVHVSPEILSSSLENTSRLIFHVPHSQTVQEQSLRCESIMQRQFFIQRGNPSSFLTKGLLKKMLCVVSGNGKGFSLFSCYTQLSNLL